MPEEAYDLFSGTYVMVPTEAEKAAASAEAVYAHRRAKISMAFEDMVLYGFAELKIGWDFGEEIKASRYSDYFYTPPTYGPAPAAKPDQPRAWVARNQAPKSFRRK